VNLVRTLWRIAFSASSAVLLAALAALALGLLGTRWLVGVAAVCVIVMIASWAFERKREERKLREQAEATQRARTVALQREIDAQMAKERFVEKQQLAVLDAFRRENNLP